MATTNKKASKSQAPKKQSEPIPAETYLSVDGIVDNFMTSILDRESEYVEILDKLTDRIFWKLSHDAEILQERASIAKTRLDEALKVLAKGGSKKS